MTTSNVVIILNHFVMYSGSVGTERKMIEYLLVH